MTIEDPINAADFLRCPFRSKRERLERAGDRSQRERLERASPSGARRNLVDILNAGTQQNAARELPGADAIERIRQMQKFGYKGAEAHNRAHAKFEKAGGVEGFNLLHPDALRRASRFDENFKPGQDVSPVGAARDDARDQAYTPDLAEARRLLDAAGQLIAEARTRTSLTASGRVESIEAS